MEKKIDTLRDHLIICGAGKTGWEVMSEFRKRGEPFVAIDRNEEKIASIVAENPDMYCIAGEATHEATLLRAGVERAQGIVFALTGDTENIVGVLTARALNENMLIIARGENQESVGKLTRAGANHIILPTQLAGMRIASFILNPSVIDFLDCMTRDKGLQLVLEDVLVRPEGPLDGKMLRDSRIREKSNAIVVAIRRDMEYMVNPPVDTVLRAGDVLLVLGHKDQLRQLFAYTGGEMGWRAQSPSRES
jgi:voltage-gated potassium channel